MVEMRRRVLRQILALLLVMVLTAGVYFMVDNSNMPVIAECIDCDNRERHGLSSIDRRPNPTLPEPVDQMQLSAADATRLFRNQETTVSQSTFQVALEKQRTDIIISDLWPMATELQRPPEMPSKTAAKMLPTTPTFDHGVKLVGLNYTRCAVSLLGDDDLVRNCITNEVIGRIPHDIRTAPFRSSKGNSPETAEDRRHSFRKVFDTRAWGHDWDAQHKGLNASGNALFSLYTIM